MIKHCKEKDFTDRNRAFAKAVANGNFDGSDPRQDGSFLPVVEYKSFLPIPKESAFSNDFKTYAFEATEASASDISEELGNLFGFASEAQFTEDLTG